MKKTLLVCFVSSMFFAANAQIEKGSIFTGGSVGFGTSETENMSSLGKTKNLNWSLTPQIGKAIKQNKVVGIQLLYSGRIIKNEPAQNLDNKSNITYLGAGIFYREYFPIYKKWFFYGQGTLSGSWSKNEQKIQGIRSASGDGWSAGIDGALGISYQAGSRCWLEAGISNLFNIGYNNSNSESFQAGQVTTVTKSNNFSASFNASSFSNLAIGFRWIIPAKS